MSLPLMPAFDTIRELTYLGRTGDKNQFDFWFSPKSMQLAIIHNKRFSHFMSLSAVIRVLPNAKRLYEGTDIYYMFEAYTQYKQIIDLMIKNQSKKKIMRKYLYTLKS